MVYSAQNGAAGTLPSAVDMRRMIELSERLAGSKAFDSKSLPPSLCTSQQLMASKV